MKGFMLCHRGFEDIGAMEVKELIDAPAAPAEQAITFDTANILDICTLAYKAQSAGKIMCLLFEFEAHDDFEKSIDSFKQGLSETDLSKWCDQNSTFRMTAGRTGDQKYNSQDFMIEASRLLKDKTGNDVNLDSPDVIFHAQLIGNKGYFGIDFGGIDLSKREYRIFSHPAALKGTVAYCLARVSGYKRTDSLLDPFTKSGIIPIEAALHASRMPVNYYRKEAMAFRHLKPVQALDVESFFSKADSQIKEPSAEIIGIDSSMPSISSAQKNAKLAGVNKFINFSRIEVEWLDTKFKEKEIEKLVASPPEESKRVGNSFIEKLYKELFYQADYILADKGKMAFIARNPETLKKHAEKYKFSLKEERTVFLGKEENKVIVLER